MKSRRNLPATQNNWHALSAEEILKIFKTTFEGLSSQEARRRLSLYGSNEIQPRKKPNLFFLFLKQFQSPLIYILLLAAMVTYFLAHYIDTWVILAVVFFNALFGLLHEVKAEKAMEALAKIVALKTKVKREGVLLDLPATEIVPGDIIEITAGIKVPADLRIIESQDLRVDEAILTGESVLQEKEEKTVSENTALGDRTNMLFGGTFVSSGKGWAVAVATGLMTEFGKIAKEVGQTPEGKTPLQQRLSKFSQNYLAVVLSSVFLIFVVGVLKKLQVLEMFLTALAAAISAIPEGLPAVITVTLATGAYRMARRRAIVRKLMAVETLGSITTIASDKTGTLTHNQMTIEKIYSFINNQIYKITGSGYEPKGEFKPALDENLRQFLTNGLLCSDAEIFEEKHASREWAVSGDPTDGAFVAAAEKAEIAKENNEKIHPRLDEIPFETKSGIMVTLNKFDSQNILIAKGKVERILELSSLDQANKDKILQINQNFASNALRVIAIAVKIVNANKKEIIQSGLKDFQFLGLAGMIDPPRKEAAEAIRLCQKSGIRPIMVTGDYPATATAIAKDLGMDSGEVISQDELEKLGADEFQQVIKKVSVFARIAPEMKLRIVEGLQNSGEIVAVTGDGINDAPALKKADIGVAMGEGGTDVSREVADLVLADNNFATVVGAIEEGRTIFQNIRRVIFYLLSTSVGELLILLFAVIFYLPPFNLPLLPVQILWLNLVTDGTAGLSLALEPTHKGVMNFPPRSPKKNILNRIIVERMILVGLVMLVGTIFLYSLEIKAGADISRARTIAFTTMVVFQVLNVLNSRSLRESIFGMPFLSNRYVLGSMLMSFLLSYLTVSLPFMRTIFHTTPLSLVDWLKIMTVSLSIILVVEIEKLIRRKTHAKY